MTEKTTSRWVSFAVLYLCSVIGILAFQSIPPVLSLIIKELNISHADAGLLMSITSLPGIFIAIPIGTLADRYGTRRLNIIGLVLVIAGLLLMGSANNFLMLLAGRVIVGLGTTSISILCSQAIALLFLDRRLGLAMSILQSNFPIAVLTAMNLLSAAGITFGWRAGFYIVTLCAILVLVLFILLFKPAVSRHISAQKVTLKEQFSGGGIPWLFWMLACSIGVFFMISAGIFTFTPDFLYSKGLDLKTAGLYTSLLVIIPLAVLPFIGIVLDRVKLREVPVIIGAVCSGILLLLIPGGTGFIIPILLLSGIFNCVIPATQYTLLPELVGKKVVGLCMGIAVTISNLISIPSLYLLGLARDATGNYEATYTAMAGAFFLMTLIMVVILVIRRRKGNLPAQ
jgi:MFS transporter, NNP family, nitrate/nitrite transporter